MEMFVHLHAPHPLSHSCVEPRRWPTPGGDIGGVVVLLPAWYACVFFVWPDIIPQETTMDSLACIPNSWPFNMLNMLSINSLFLLLLTPFNFSHIRFSSSPPPPPPPPPLFSPPPSLPPLLQSPRLFPLQRAEHLWTSCWVLFRWKWRNGRRRPANLTESMRKVSHAPSRDWVQEAPGFTT